MIIKHERQGLCGWTKAMNLWRFGVEYFLGNMFLEWLFPLRQSSDIAHKDCIFMRRYCNDHDDWVQVKFRVEESENVMRIIRFQFSCNIHAASSHLPHRLGAPSTHHLTFFLLQWNVDSWRSFRWKWECLKTMKGNIHWSIHESSLDFMNFLFAKWIASSWCLLALAFLLSARYGALCIFKDVFVWLPGWVGGLGKKTWGM